jgi:hypothetical protein
MSIVTNENLNVKAFLATVVKVLLEPKDFEELKTDKDYIMLYNDNKSFFSDIDGKNKNTAYLGSIVWNTSYSIQKPNYAFPFDKNNITYPIEGETILIIEMYNQYYWLPYSKTQYPNYRQDYAILKKSQPRDYENVQSTVRSNDYRETSTTGTTNISKKVDQPGGNKNKYLVNEKVKYLKPYQGDTIITSRGGSSIRLTQNLKNIKLSPGIIISNGQNVDTINQPIGFLAEEDINKDGSSLYITSGNTIVGFDFKKTKTNTPAWGTLPTDLKGNQVYLNSDRVVLSSKQSEFIIFGKGHTGVISGNRYTVDATNDIYLHSESNVTIHSAGGNQIFLNSENGKIYLGKNKGVGAAGADVQKMVMGGELVKILGQLIDEITKQVYATGSGPTSTGPANIAQFQAIKRRLSTILSDKNFLSKT